MKRRTIILGWTFVVLVVLTVTLVGSHPFLIQMVLDHQVAKVITRFKNRYDRELHIGKARFVSFSRLTIDTVVIKNKLYPDQALLSVSEIDLRVDGIDYLLGGLGIKKIVVDNPEIELIKYTDTTANFLDFVRRPAVRPDSNAVQSGNGSADRKNIEDLLERYFQIQLPEVYVNNARITFIDSTIIRENQNGGDENEEEESEKNFKVEIVGLYAKLVKKKNGESSDISVTGRAIESSNADFKTLFEVKGQIDHYQNELLCDFRFSRNFKIPFVETLIPETEISFKEAHLHLLSFRQTADSENLKAEFGVKEFEIFSPALSATRLNRIDFGLELDVSFETDGDSKHLIVNSATRAYLNEITCFFGGALRNYQADKPQVEINVSLDTIDCALLYSAIPSGLISKLKGLKVRGSMAYDLSVSIDLADLDSIHVDASVYLSDDFKIFTMGRYINFRPLEKPFYYTVELLDERDSVFLVGAEDTVWGTKNEDFVPYDSLSRYVINGTLTNEDAAFYKHHGFNVYQVERSIANNIEAGAFVRGASTVSMQLVKNLFLTREKTLSRKFQEVIITFLMENQEYLTKERMLEIYFNVIEWGPDIYGIPGDCSPHLS